MVSGKIYNIMICSPSDANNFREICQEAFFDWDKQFSTISNLVFIPTMYEDIFSKANYRNPQEQIDSEITLKADFGIAIFNKERGSVFPEYQNNDLYPLTYTDHEIETLRRLNKDVYVYFNKENKKQLKDFIYQIGFVNETTEAKFYSDIKDLLTNIRDKITLNPNFTNRQIYNEIESRPLIGYTSTELKILETIIGLKEFNVSSVSKLLGFNTETIRRFVHRLVTQGIVFKCGSNKNVYYKVINDIELINIDGKIAVRPKEK